MLYRCVRIPNPLGQMLFAVGPVLRRPGGILMLRDEPRVPTARECQGVALCERLPCAPCCRANAFNPRLNFRQPLPVLRLSLGLGRSCRDDKDCLVADTMQPLVFRTDILGDGLTRLRCT